MKSFLLSWLSNLDVSDIVLNSILGLALMIIIVSAWRFHRDKGFRKFNLFKLITHPDGTPSRPAIQEFVAFGITSWGFILLINKGNLPEWYMMSYLAIFVARAAHNAYLNSKNNAKNNKK